MIKEDWVIVFTMPSGDLMAASKTDEGYFAMVPITKDGQIKQAMSFPNPEACRKFLDELFRPMTKEMKSHWKQVRPRFVKDQRPN